MSQYFSKPYKHFGRDTSGDLSNYPTKTDFKNATVLVHLN